ncbi:translationally controlled tumor-associated [Boletus coccyginus]|nr:translationally controlled tumor-associated [Boletus coccyginus]
MISDLLRLVSSSSTMLLYQDVVTGDEMFSDAFPVKLIDDIAYEVDCKTIIVKPGADIDIGANPSAEDQDEALEDGAKQVNDVVHSFRLQEVSKFDKKGYLTHIKDYMKKVKKHLEEHHPDGVKEFETGAAAYVKKIVANLKDYDFYNGESMDPNGMVALLNYREDGITPYFTFWKHGLKEVKL